LNELSMLERACSTHEESFLFPFHTSVHVGVEPIEAYCALPSTECAYLLESADGEGRGRFSFVGSHPLALITMRARHLIFEPMEKNELTERIERTLEHTLTHDGKGYLLEDMDVLDALRLVHPVSCIPVVSCDTKRQLLDGGLVGALGYEAAYSCWLKELVRDDVLCGAFMLTTSNMVFDHRKGCVHLLACEVVHPQSPDEARLRAERRLCEMKDILRRARRPSCRGAQVGDVDYRVNSLRSKQQPQEHTSKEQFERMVARAKQHVFDGDVFQVVLSRKCTIPTDATPVELYTALRSINPSPYMYLLHFPKFAIIGASPERMLSVYDGVLTVNPIAGTYPRGTPEQEERLAAGLLGDEKERAEHVMLVDLARNDVRMVCRPGSVRVSEFMRVKRYSHVQHIESTVEGRLRDGMDVFDAIRAVFPAGTLSGAPKLRAMEIIHELEGRPRGFYGGGVGYISLSGSADFAITIRTIVLEDGVASVQAGAGIVADSVPSREYEETCSKMGAMLEAIRSLAIQREVGT